MFLKPLKADVFASRCSVRDSVEKLYDSDHPDVFLHLQQAGGNFENIAPPNTTEVLLLASSVAVNGFTNAGSLYRGSGYWGSGPDLPQALSDLNVRPSFISWFMLR